MIEIVSTICLAAVLCTAIVSLAVVRVATIRAEGRPPSLAEALGMIRAGGDDR